MRNLTNIEKSAFRAGEYVGYGGGRVWRIAKTNRPYGNWLARANSDPPMTTLYAWRLSDLSAKLEALSAQSAVALTGQP